MVKEKRILSYFIGWLIVGITICFIGISDVFASTVEKPLTFATEVNQELYHVGWDEWITCTNYTCPLWTHDGLDGTISWIAYKFYTELEANTTYFLELTTTFDYKENEYPEVPVWKFSNYYGKGDNYSPKIHFMNYCNLVDSTITYNKDIYRWKCSFTPTENVSDFQFYFWTNQNYESLSQYGYFLPRNESTITLSGLRLSYLDNTTGSLIVQNEIIIEQNKQTNEKLDDIQNAITDSSGPNTSELENSAGWLPPGPLDSVLNLPLSLFNALTTNLNKSCNPINIPLPYVNKNLSLPCINTLYNKIGITSFLSWIGVIVSGLMLYSYLLKLYKWIEDRISLNETHNVDGWGGL